MSLGIAFKGPAGIVLAADSRVTLFSQPIPTPTQGQTIVLPATFDHGTKLFGVRGQDFVGVITYGLGAIGEREPRTADSYVPEFEAELKETKRLSVADFASRLSDFFMRQWRTQMPENYAGEPMVFHIGGYDEGAPYGRLFTFDIPKHPHPEEVSVGQFGMIWGGQREFVDRLLQGFDDALPVTVQKFLNLTDPQIAELKPHLKANLAVKVPYQFLPLQDCVDIAIFLIRATIKMQTFLVGMRGVGGAIDVATITRTDGFQAIQEKEIVGERATSI